VLIARADLPSNLSASKLRRVHVCMRSTITDGFQGGSEIHESLPCAAVPVTFAATIVPVMDPDVAAGQAGITAPATLVAKCKCDTTRFDERLENVSEKVMTLSGFSV
jgi:hypothetical protein